MIDNTFGYPENGIVTYTVHWKDEVVCIAEVDYTGRSLTRYETMTDDWWKLPCGTMKNPTLEQFLDYLDYRCWERGYAALQKMYDQYNVSPRNRYNLVVAMGGRSTVDEAWIEVQDGK